jgi:hypothetical protein
MAVCCEGPLLPFDFGLGVETAHVGGVWRVLIHFDVHFGVEANVDRARVHETAYAMHVARADEVFDAAHIRVVPAEQREMRGGMKHGVDACAGFHHAVRIFDFALEDLELRVLELQGRVANDGPDRAALVEKASNQMAAQETGCASDETGSEIVEWFGGRH